MAYIDQLTHFILSIFHLFLDQLDIIILLSRVRMKCQWMYRYQVLKMSVNKDIGLMESSDLANKAFSTVRTFGGSNVTS